MEGDARSDTFWSEMEGVKSIVYYKNYAKASARGSTRRSSPPLAPVCGATNTPGDCAAAPTRPAPGPLQWYTVVEARPLPVTAVPAIPSAPGLFFPKRSFRCYRKTCATIVISIWCCHPGYCRTSSWAIPSSVLPSSTHCSTAQRRPLNQTKVLKGVLTGALLLS